MAHLDQFLEDLKESIENDPDFYLQKSAYIRLVQMKLPVALTDFYKLEHMKEDVSNVLSILDANSAEEFLEEINLVLSQLEKLSWPLEENALLSITEKLCSPLFLGKFGIS